MFWWNWTAMYIMWCAIGSKAGSVSPGQDMDTTDDETEETLGLIDTDDNKIVINVGGIRHETLVCSLIQKEGTRLCHLGQKHLAGAKREYFYDRHPGVFSTVMDYYRSGELHVPLDVCGAVVKRELDFWKINYTLIEPCCWTNYSSYIDNQQTLSDFNQSVEQENEEMTAMQSVTGWKKKQMMIWMILDHPRSSRLAMSYAVTSFLFVIASIAGFCIETLPVMHTLKNVTRECAGEQNRTFETRVGTPFLENLDYLCTAFFTLELIIRVLMAPNRLVFFRSVMNIIDILALMPLYVQIILDSTDLNSCQKNNTAVLETIFVLRIIRIFRIFHLVKHYRALKILVHAIKASIQELLMLLIFLFIGTLVFSTLIFYAERPLSYNYLVGGKNEGQFGNIPIGFWWSIVTMTTVGYGDIAPTTPMGYVIGAICSIGGVLLMALTIPVISNNFALFYLHARTRESISMKNSSSAANKLKSKSPSNNSEGKRGMDSRALLRHDSISTTDESGSVLNPKTGQSAANNSADSSTPQQNQHANQTNVRILVPMANIDETVM